MSQASQQHSTDTASLHLADHGWFYVGGNYTGLDDAGPMAGQMYVEYFIPENQTHPYPVVMFHGGSQTGTNYTGTPDGRRGWAHDFCSRVMRSMSSIRRGGAVQIMPNCCMAITPASKVRRRIAKYALRHRKPSAIGRMRHCIRNGPVPACMAMMFSTIFSLHKLTKLQTVRSLRP